MAETAKIAVERLVKSFGPKSVFTDVSLTIRPGETMVIMGQSGCGKSVLLKHMIGLIRPDDGRVLIDGVDLWGLSGGELDKVRMKFGMLFQSAALFDSMTVEENVGFALREHSGMPSAQVRQRVQECLGLVGMPNVQDRYPSELSGGMRKRVGLARAIAMHPDIVLYDEPTTGLDPIMADTINELIIALRDRLKVTSVVVTHDMRSAYKVADRIGMLYNGAILQVGTVDEIRHSPNPIVQQFIKGEAVGPIQEGLPDRRVLSRLARTRTGPPARH